MPGVKTFLDSNILIYAYDISAGDKHNISRDILIELWDNGLGCLSTQVLQEFYVTLTMKIKNKMNSSAVKGLVEDFLKWDVIVNDGQCILDGIELQKKYKYSFWDSMIIQSAIKSKAKLLISEDLSAGQTIEGVNIKNPFL